MKRPLMVIAVVLAWTVSWRCCSHEHAVASSLVDVTAPQGSAGAHLMSYPPARVAPQVPAPSPPR